jgi:hypothetical protein
MGSPVRKENEGFELFKAARALDNKELKLYLKNGTVFWSVSVANGKHPSYINPESAKKYGKNKGRWHNGIKKKIKFTLRGETA